jgi:hypothetical protein
MTAVPTTAITLSPSEFSISEKQRIGIPFRTILQHVGISPNLICTLAITCFGDLVFIQETEDIHTVTPGRSGNDALNPSYIRFVSANFLAVSTLVAFLQDRAVTVDGKIWYAVNLPMNLSLTVVPIIPATQEGFAPHRFAHRLSMANKTMLRYLGEQLTQSSALLAETTDMYRISRDELRGKFDTASSHIRDKLAALQLCQEDKICGANEVHMCVLKLELSNLRAGLINLEVKQATRLAETRADILQLLNHIVELSDTK